MSTLPAPDTHWLVLKFGGTSVSKRERWDPIGKLAAERASTENARVLVVVSALSGVTNELQAISNGDDVAGRVAALVKEQVCRLTVSSIRREARKPGAVFWFKSDWRRERLAALAQRDQPAVPVR